MGSSPRLNPVAGTCHCAQNKHRQGDGGTGRSVRLRAYGGAYTIGVVGVTGRTQSSVLEGSLEAASAGALA